MFILVSLYKDTLYLTIDIEVISDQSIIYIQSPHA